MMMYADSGNAVEEEGEEEEGEEDLFKGNAGNAKRSRYTRCKVGLGDRPPAFTIN